MSEPRESALSLVKIRAFAKEHKKILIIVGLALMALHVFRSSLPRTSHKTSTYTNQEEKISSGKEKLVTALLEKPEDKKNENNLPSAAQTLVIEKSPAKKEVRRASTPRTPSYISAVQKVRQIYNSNFSYVRDATLEAKVVEEVQPAASAPKAAEAPTPTPPREERIQNPKIGLIQPGSMMRVKLITGLIAPKGRAVKFVAKLLSIKGNILPESLDFSGCYITGEASLDSFTNKVLAKATSLSCPDKYAELHADAVSSDLTTGLDGRHYSRLPQRLTIAFFESFIPGYSRARAEAEQENSATVSNLGSTTVVDSKIQNPEKYAFWQSISDFGSTLKEELSEIRRKQVPVTVVDPMDEAIFFVTAPSKITFLR